MGYMGYFLKFSRNISAIYVCTDLYVVHVFYFFKLAYSVRTWRSIHERSYDSSPTYAGRTTSIPHHYFAIHETWRTYDWCQYERKSAEPVSSIYRQTFLARCRFLSLRCEDQSLLDANPPPR